jgi:prepilin-type N-terminal cleavage/methylation domain-containing protein
MRKPNGFTLFELIAVLVILGMVGAAGSLGLMQAIQGFIRSADNNNLATKAQIALTRINTELTHIAFPYAVYDNANPLASGAGVSVSSATSITYDASFGRKNAAQTCCLTTVNNVLAYNAGASTLTLNVGGAGAQVLCDNVTAFQLRYYDNYGTAAQTTFTQPATKAVAVTSPGTQIIEATITLTGTNNAPQTFTTRIVPKFR